MRVTILFIFVLMALFVPIDSAIAQGGFVPCDGVDCNSCSLVSMINVIIVWLIGIIFVIFAVLMTVAGFGLVTSGGSQSALEAAKSKFQNGIIGIIIVLAGYVIVDTVMRGIVGGGSTGVPMGEIDGWGPWSSVRCETQTDTNPYFDLNTGQGGSPVEVGQGQVPGATATSSCSVPPLTVMTDPLAVSMEQGNAVVFNNPTLQQCATRFVSQVGGGARVNSAYRPPQYQNHLWEIRDRWCTRNLRTNTDASCSTLRSSISNEVSRHFGSGWQCGAVGATSRHTQNTAVDIGGISNHADPRVQAAANANCLTWANYPGDPWHYNLRANCTCN